MSYEEDLHARKLKVACPACGAEIGSYCKGVYGQPTKGCHWDRSATARRAGHLNVTKGSKMESTEALWGVWVSGDGEEGWYTFSTNEKTASQEQAKITCRNLTESKAHKRWTYEAMPWDATKASSPTVRTAESSNWKISQFEEIRKALQDDGTLPAAKDFAAAVRQLLHERKDMAKLFQGVGPMRPTFQAGYDAGKTDGYNKASEDEGCFVAEQIGEEAAFKQWFDSLPEAKANK